MIHGGRRAATLLFLGDIGVFSVSLFLTLLVRYGQHFDTTIFIDHIGPFSILFVLWALIFYMSGLYGKRILLNTSSLADAIVKTQFFNIVLAALFFFLLPGVGIAPKTNLVIYLVVSLFLILLWRLTFYPRLSIPRFRYPAVLIAEGEEADELVHEVNGNTRYHLSFPVVLTPAEAIAHPEALAEKIRSTHATIVVIDRTDTRTEPLIPQLYDLASFSEPAQFMGFDDVYEEVFDRIPLSQLRPSWFIENVPRTTPPVYAFSKRVIDLVGGTLMGVITIVVAPFVWIMQGFEGPGDLFIEQDRLGRGDSHIRTFKFRTMQENDAGKWSGESTNKVTKVGEFLRRTSLDEFPQFWNVLTGELSLIGPRNDMAVLGERLAEALPFYSLRYQVPPGITGWAQINQQYEQGHISPQSIEETKMRLAYDFYYLKHRSLGLDIVIALKTIKRMLFRVSSW